jgi:putative restriction endonuclease
MLTMESERNGIKWSEEETILAFDLYCRVPFSKIDKRNPQIISLAKLLGRTPSSVGLKMANLAHFDPELKKRFISGMKHASKLDEEIVALFINDWEALSYRAKKIEDMLQGQSVEKMAPIDTIEVPEGGNREQLIIARVNQQFFREAVLSSYHHSCCITGMSIPTLLVASHIKPWKVSDPKTERTNPQNGLCLNALHDRAFDKGLITVQPDLTIRVSTSIKSSSINEGVMWLQQCDGKKIKKPERFTPNRELLEYHNDVIFIP